MNQVTQGLDAIRLRSDIFQPLLNYDWDEAINENAAQGEVKAETVKLLESCKIQGATLRKVSNWTVTPETLAWLTLWTRNFNLLQGAIAILESLVGIAQSGQEFSLRLLWRPAFELWVTLNFILTEGVVGIVNREPEKQTLSERLCAYLAWCFWNDKEVAHKLTQGWRLDEIFGKGNKLPTEEEKLINRLMETHWGDEKAFDQERDRQTKRLVRENYLNERNQLRRWLQHEKLSDFEDRIRNEKPRSYFELVAPENRSIADCLRSSWSDAGYPLYQEASALIHGSTFLHHMELIDSHLFPRFAASAADVQRQASHIRRHCHFNAIILLHIQERMETERMV